MSDVKLAIPEEGKNDKETIQNLLDTMMKYRKELEFILNHLDQKNVPVLGKFMEDTEGNFSQINQTVDQIDLTVGDNTGNISGLTLRADTIESNVSAIDTRLGTAESSIIQHSDEIALKVSQSLYDVDIPSLQGRVSNAESSIVQNADSITSKVSQTDFTGSTIISEIEQTASTIKLSASAIELDGITNVADTLTLGDTFTDASLVWDGKFSISTDYGLSRATLNANGDISLVASNKISFANQTVDFYNATIENLKVIAVFG